MIKINLLQVKSAAGSSAAASAQIIGDGESLKKEGLKRILIILLFPIGLYVFETQNIPQKKKKIVELNEQIRSLKEYNTKLDSSAKQIEQFKVEEGQFNVQLEALNKLTKSRKSEIRVFSLFQNVIPEKVWLKSISIDRMQNNERNEIKIEGYGASDEEIKKFVDSLEKSVYLQKTVTTKREPVTLPGQGSQIFRYFIITAESGAY